MSSDRVPRGLLAAALLLVPATAALAADDPCAGYPWNVAHERTLFAAPAHAGMAGRDAGSAPAIRLDRLYELSLAPQREVQFAVRPSDKTLARATYAGLVRLKVPAAGLYRISAADRSWIDVAVGGELLHPRSFMGREGCTAPRKIVQFELASGEIVLQVSNATDQVRFLVTRAPGGEGHAH
jgi:hypothetical protein